MLCQTGGKQFCAATKVLQRSVPWIMLPSLNPVDKKETPFQRHSDVIKIV